MTDKSSLRIDKTIDNLDDLSDVFKELRRLSKTIITMQQRKEYNSSERVETEKKYDELIRSLKLNTLLKDVYITLDAYLAVEKGTNERYGRIRDTQPDLDCITHEFNH